jgi:N-acetylneuraminate synthase
LETYRQRYAGCAVGLSDHSGTIYPGLAAATLGASVVEVHVTFSRDCFGPDVASSLTVAELAQLVAGVRCNEKMRDHPLDKDAQAQQLAGMRDLFTRSVVARCDLAAGTLLAEQHLAWKKPGTGIPASRWREVLGRKLVRNITADSLLHEDDLEPEHA